MALPLVIICEEIDSDALAWLDRRAQTIRCSADDPGFAPLLQRAAGIVVRTYTRIDRSLLELAPNLKVVARAGVGLDNIDVPACRARGIEVVHTPDANTRAVVELVTAFILDALRPRLFLEGPLDPKAWRALRAELTAPRQLCELTLGILGFGRVGRGVSQVAEALRMRVLMNDVRDIPIADRGAATPVDVPTLFSEADILTVHIDDRPTNTGFVDARRLRLLKSGALFINTSRGFVVDNSGLVEWLRSDGSGQAILDVHEPEPFGSNYPFLGLKNARLSPHIGAATALAHRNMSWVVHDVDRVLSGLPASHPAPRGWQS